MKTKTFDYNMEVPDTFDEVNFENDLIDLSWKYDCRLAGNLKEYEVNKWKKIKQLLSEVWFTFRWGV
jgi:hypothetical protein